MPSPTSSRYAPTRHTAFALGGSLKELAQLEEEHDEDRLGELRLGSRQEAYAECADGGDAHEEVLVEELAMSHSLDRLAEYVVPYNKVWHEVDQEELPHWERRGALYDVSPDE